MTRTAILPLASIFVEDRLRQVNEDAAQRLAVSLSKSRLINAITVRPIDDGSYQLVAGAHRLHAHALLQRDDIRAEIWDISKEEAWIIEIEENLFRDDLLHAERILSLGLWDRDFRAQHPEFRRGGDRRSSDWHDQTASWEFGSYEEIMERRTNRSQTRNYADLRVFRALEEHGIRQLLGSPIEDNFSQIDAVSRLEPSKRNKVIPLLAKHKALNVKTALELTSGPGQRAVSEDEKWTIAFHNLWEKGSKKAQKKIRDQIKANTL